MMANPTTPVGAADHEPLRMGWAIQEWAITSETRTLTLREPSTDASAWIDVDGALGCTGKPLSEVPIDVRVYLVRWWLRCVEISIGQRP